MDEVLVGEEGIGNVDTSLTIGMLIRSCDIPDHTRSAPMARVRTRKRRKRCRCNPNCLKKLAYSSRLRHYRFADAEYILPSETGSSETGSSDVELSDLPLDDLQDRDLSRRPRTSRSLQNPRNSIEVLHDQSDDSDSSDYNSTVSIQEDHSDGEVEWGLTREERLSLDEICDDLRGIMGPEGETEIWRLREYSLG